MPYFRVTQAFTVANNSYQIGDKVQNNDYITVDEDPDLMQKVVRVPDDPEPIASVPIIIPSE